MRRVHLFNADNDGALAVNRASYTPPAMAGALERDLALLPAVWAAPGDYIIAPAGTALPAWMMERGMRIYHGEADAEVAEPWGWSLNARLRLRRAGVPEGLLPDDEELERHREQSHRRTAMLLARGLEAEGIASPNRPVEITSAEELRALMAGGHRLMVKRPWSCSGRGVFPLAHLSEQRAAELAEGIIRRQGSVMVERMLDRKADFSAILHSDGRSVKLRGWTLFQTSAEGRYEGTLIAPQELIGERIEALGADTRRLGAALERNLSPLIAGYCGWLSVDMLATTDGEIAPCIEVNLRRTMGVVALDIAEQMPLGEPPMLMSVRGASEPLRADERVITGGESFRLSLTATD
ncbi:MAG: hypothetical protein NC187_05445 [Candidatus Amulumruptor caecigallinarius]|nr:hypothetical protein [Candidatus Amulumruptor caecigallinarius]MCM1396915.1 hypothetical protein [Candidatus Amulumruptor caecigallinarius]MCM1454141.1 hypothetical protein [bacterium]